MMILIVDIQSWALYLEPRIRFINASIFRTTSILIRITSDSKIHSSHLVNPMRTIVSRSTPPCKPKVTPY